MESGDVLVEAREIGRKHPNGRDLLLDRISLEITAGKRLAVRGPSGAGKTLLLRALAMLDPLDCGRIAWHGKNVPRDSIPLMRGSILYLHQRASLLEEEVEAALRKPFELRVHRHRSFARERALELLDVLGRDASFLEKTVGDLSGGEIQIVALVRALLLDPEVLLLDEATSALDPAATTAVESLLDRWIAERVGRATVWVCHDPRQALRVADAVVTMEGGRLCTTSN